MSYALNAHRESTAFFGFSLSRAFAFKVFGPKLVSLSTEVVIVATSPRWRPDADPSLPGRTSLAPYPASIDAIFSLLLSDDDDRAGRDRLEVLIPKGVFLELADGAGVDHFTELTLSVGVATDDPIMVALQECFAGLRALSSRGADALAERIVNSLNTHLAERYGNMRKSVGTPRGGLAPWQLRAAQGALNNLHSAASLDEVARECGLSTGHFARAFKRSMGKSPRQWAVLRRVETAKAMMSNGVSLAEIAVACRFSDQSHLTRAFAQVTGSTPGKWRTDRAMMQHAVT